MLILVYFSGESSSIIYEVVSLIDGLFVELRFLYGEDVFKEALLVKWFVK